VGAENLADIVELRLAARARNAVELALSRHEVEEHAKDAMLKALKEVERAWQKAMDKIAERASLIKSSGAA
jgi:hypothetical protein